MTRDLQAVERFIAEHPTQAHLWGLGIPLFVFLLAMTIKELLVWLGRSFF